jgi:hypothetical protein
VTRKVPLLSMNTETGRFGVATHAEAETFDATVCMPWSDPPILPDNVRGSCAHCGIALQFRPDAPRRPIKVCPKCVVAWARPN